MIVTPLVDRTCVTVVRLRPVSVVTVKDEQCGFDTARCLFKKDCFHFDGKLVGNQRQWWQIMRTFSAKIHGPLKFASIVRFRPIEQNDVPT